MAGGLLLPRLMTNKRATLQAEWPLALKEFLGVDVARDLMIKRLRVFLSDSLRKNILLF